MVRAVRHGSLRILGAFAVCALAAPPAGLAAAPPPPLGEAYTGPRCVAVVGAFPVHLEGAPAEIGEGLRQMLRTALFESNWFLVADREAAAGVAAERLLADEFLEDADAILGAGGAAEAAGIVVTGALLDLEGGGFGLRVKLPGAPLTVGAASGEARVLVMLQATDIASGSILASIQVEGTAGSGRAMVGTALAAGELPAALAVAHNTPLELALRDCVNRGVVGLIAALPRAVFNRESP